MFSSRLPSFNDCLHFMNTSVGKVRGNARANEFFDIPVHIPCKASSPSRSFMTSGETDRMGEANEIMVYRASGSPQDSLQAREAQEWLADSPGA